MVNPQYELELQRLRPEYRTPYNRGWLARTHASNSVASPFEFLPNTATEFDRVEWFRGWSMAEQSPVHFWTSTKRVILFPGKPTVYTASRTCHAPKWRELRAQGVVVIATWFDLVGLVDGAYSVLAQNCILEPLRADVTLLYSEPEDHLKFGLVEVGAALAGGHHVIVIGDGPSISPTMLAHPRVQQVATIPLALELVSCFSPLPYEKQHNPGSPTAS